MSENIIHPRDAGPRFAKKAGLAEEPLPMKRHSGTIKAALPGFGIAIPSAATPRPARFETFCTRGAIMSLKHDRGRSISNYDECTVLLLSAFFCVTGQTSEDAHLRRAIEGVLVDLIKAQNGTASSNIVQFCRQNPHFR